MWVIVVVLLASHSVGYANFNGEILQYKDKAACVKALPDVGPALDTVLGAGTFTAHCAQLK